MIYAVFLVDPKVFSFVVKEVKVIFLRGSKNPMGKLKFRTFILKMTTARNVSMSGINSGHHNLPTYEMSLKSDNVEFVLYCGGHYKI
jgi:hypothetical protein